MEDGLIIRGSPKGYQVPVRNLHVSHSFELIVQDFLDTGYFVTKIQQLFLMYAVVWVPFDFMLLRPHVNVSASDSYSQSHRSVNVSPIDLGTQGM